jgi:metabotropic glutamate receptor 1
MIRLNLYLLLILILALVVLLTNGRISKRKQIRIEGDLMIGALLPVHESFVTEPIDIGSKPECGVIRDQYGIQRVESLFYILDKINSNKNGGIRNLLPGVKLGLDIRDECWETSVALEETIDFIKDTIAFDRDRDGLHDSLYHRTENNQDFNNNNNDLMLTNESYICSKYFNLSMSNSEFLIKQIKQQQKQTTINHERIIAVIGPAGSSVAINVQNLLQLFEIPQIGYSATTRELSDKKMYKTFLRVVPSDYLQVRAIVDFVVKMNWTYIYAIYTEGIKIFNSNISFLFII